LAHLLAAAPMALAARRAVAQGTAWSMATEYPATRVGRRPADVAPLARRRRRSARLHAPGA